MELYYFRNNNNNFGDALNGWLWERLLPGAFDSDLGGADLTLCGIGTIVNDKMPTGRRWVVFGSGVGYGARPTDFGGPNWDISAVRGPLSARILGLPSDRAVTDGAIFLASLPEFQALPENERRGILFVPHYQAMRTGRWEEVCALAGIEFLNPVEDSKKVISRIRSAKLVIADAMHAAIIADTMRVPWVPASISPMTNSFKWYDWASSLGLPHRPVRLPPSTLKDQLFAKTLPLFGERHFVPGGQEEALLAYHEKINKLHVTAGWGQVSRVTRRASKDITNVICSLFDAPSGPAARRRLDIAAKALIDCSKGPSYLSPQPVFEARLTTMIERLEGLKKRLR